MDVMSHSTLQLPLPVQLVARTSQNLHSLRGFIIEASGKGEKRKDSELGLQKTFSLLCKNIKQTQAHFHIHNWVEYAEFSIKMTDY